MTDAESICREVYLETRAKYAESAPQLRTAALGFRILYGPPVARASYLFVGFQPGGRQDESAKGQHAVWPRQSWYASGNSKGPLAPRIRHVFGVEEVTHTGLNMVFFRAPNIAAWNEVPRDLRSELEDFSRERLQRIATALQPRRMIVIGLKTFKILTGKDGRVVLGDQSGGRLAVEDGDLWGLRTTGIIHLSARVSREKLDRLKRFFEGENRN